MPPPPADLLRALVDLAPDARTLRRIADLLSPGWSPEPVLPAEKPPVIWPPTRFARRPPADAEQAVPATTPKPTGLSLPSTLTVLARGAPDPPSWLSAGTGLPVAPTLPGPAPSPPPLLRREQARGILVAALGAARETREVDVEAVVDEVSRGHELRRLPRVRVRSVPPRVQLLLDRGERMLPFFADERSLVEDVERVFGAGRLEVLRFDGCPGFGLGPGARRTWSRDYAAHRPPVGSCVVVATDLGIGAELETDAWLAFARELRRAGCRLVALVPYGPHRWPRELRRRFDLVHWDRTTTASRAATFVRRPADASPAAPARELEQLAARCAFAVRVDPALLRTLRIELLPGVDAGVEADLWASPLARFRGPDGFVFDPERADDLRRWLSADGTAYDVAWSVTRRLHGHLPETVRLQEELLYRYRGKQPTLDARGGELLRGAVATLVYDAALAPWAARALASLPESLRASDEGQMLRTAAHLRLTDRLVATTDLPPGELPEWVGWVAPDGLDGVRIGVELIEGGVVLSEPPEPDVHVITVPRTRPIVVAVGETSVEIEPGTTRRIAAGGDDVRIRSAVGTTWALEPARVDLLELLFDRDPVVSRGVLEDLLRVPEVIPQVVDGLRDLADATKVTLRELLGAHAERSGPLMVERILNADDDWRAAVAVPSLMSPAHREGCEKVLAERMKTPWDDIDALRLSIEALGQMGAVEQAPAIAQFLHDQADGFSDDLFDKYHTYCVEALARIVVLSDGESALGELESAIRLVSPRGWNQGGLRAVQQIMSRASKGLAMALVRWLESEVQEIRDIAAFALGGTGDEQHVGELLRRVNDPSEKVRRTALFAVGIIGGTTAVEALARLDASGARNDALVMCVADAWNDERFRELAGRLLKEDVETAWIHRAIGIRQDESFMSVLFSGLTDRDPSVRGDAALALARVIGPEAGSSLLESWDAAASSRERALRSVAVLLTGAAPPDDPGLELLRRALAEESLQYRSRTKRDILETLRVVDHPAARGIAAAWAPIYATSSAY